MFNEDPSQPNAEAETPDTSLARECVLFDDEASLVMPLAPRRALFVQEFLVDLNGTKAASRCGWADPSQAAYLLLRDPVVVAAIEVEKARRLTRVSITQDQVLDEMALLALSRIDHYIVDDEGTVQLAAGAPANAMAAVQSIDKKTTVRTDKEGNTTITYDVKIKLWDKPTPLRLMGRHVGLFADKVEHTGANGGPIETVTRIERRIIDPAAENYTEGPHTTH